MAISRKEIEHIASLARLDSTGGIFDRLADDMQGIVAMVDKLAELDLGDITDVINTERKNAFHEDEVIQEVTPDELIEPNAPDFQCGGVAAGAVSVGDAVSVLLRTSLLLFLTCSVRVKLRLRSLPENSIVVIDCVYQLV